MTDDMAPESVRSMIGIGGAMDRVDHLGRRSVKEMGDVVAGRRPIGFEGQPTVPAPRTMVSAMAFCVSMGVDPARLKAAHVPTDAGFATKPQIATAMIERALAAGVPFRWVAADSVYGVGTLEMALRLAGKGYVLGVNRNSRFNSWGKTKVFAGTSEKIAHGLDPTHWRRAHQAQAGQAHLRRKSQL